MKKKRRKFKPYEVFCASDDDTVVETFRTFTKKTREIFHLSDCSNLFEEITTSNAYIFLLDISAYQSIQEKLDERYGNKKIKPLIYIVGYVTLAELGTLSEWVSLWGLEPKDETFQKINVSRSRIRANKSVIAP